ncbi:flocculation protein FLO11-like [Seriola dumerili]|uniref:flocculation protein FLO11-like n=1 Tax=Seriola dumerili TaxID=41447 RepID=UPI000BBEACF5|nr:flocculation protein FLO11-like [Seriola dumerili]
MAAALFRRGPGLCFRCIHRELCRVVWRPQAALFSSKPSDRKLPRRTHIKKAKPQPAVDVAKLLEQLFSQRRPGTAPPAAGKAKPAKASSNPPTTSSVKVFTSNVPRLSKTEPADSVSPAASTVSKKTTSTSNTAPRPPQPKSATSANPKTSFSSETPKQFPLGIIQDITSDGVSGVTVPPTSTMPASSGSEAATVECQPPAETRETKVETAAEADELTAAPVLPLSAYMVEKNVEKSFVPAATGEPLIETTTEPSVEASLPPVETLETKASADEGPVEPIIDIAVDTAHQEVQITSTDSVEPSIETTIEPSVDTGITPRSLKTDELAQTKFILDEKAGRRLEELLSVRTGVGAEHKAAAEAENSTEDESETSTKVLSKWDSLSEDLQELEGETDSLMKELLCHVPAALSKPPATVKTSSASDQPVGVSGDSSLQMEEKAGEEEAMTLESITLAEVNAEVGDLETEVLQETSNALEKEANLLAKEEKMEVETAIEDVVFEDTTEAEILTLESISEATDAIEAETSVMLEAMFGSEQGLTQSPDTLTPGPQNEMIGRGAETESGEQEGGVSEAVSLESVTLAEVEASFATLEDQSLSETTAYLESEAEILAGKRKKEEGELAASDDMIEDVNVESRSLPEADGLSEDLQTDALMEELLFTVPGHVAGITEPQRLINILDAAVATGSEGVDTAATDASGFPASPALKEVLLEQELVEEGAQTEALGNEGGTGTHTDLDPVQRLVLEKIREYNNMRRLSVGPVGAGPDYERYLSEETAKLQRLYGGGDLGIFPQFTFTEPEMDQDST